MSSVTKYDYSAITVLTGRNNYRQWASGIIALTRFHNTFDVLSEKNKPTQADPDPTKHTDEEKKELKKEIRRAERENFKEKYTKAFPKFTFYIHADVMEEDQEAARGLCERIEYLGGVCRVPFYVITSI